MRMGGYSFPRRLERAGLDMHYSKTGLASNVSVFDLFDHDNETQTILMHRGDMIADLSLCRQLRP